MRDMTNDDDDDITICICMPITNDRPAPVPESTREQASCGHAVWLSPRTAIHVRRTSARLVCAPCALREFGLHDIVNNACYTPEQLTELPPDIRAVVTTLFQPAAGGADGGLVS